MFYYNTKSNISIIIILSILAFFSLYSSHLVAGSSENNKDLIGVWEGTMNDKVKYTFKVEAVPKNASQYTYNLNIGEPASCYINDIELFKIEEGKFFMKFLDGDGRKCIGLSHKAKGTMEIIIINDKQLKITIGIGSKEHGEYKDYVGTTTLTKVTKVK